MIEVGRERIWFFDTHCQWYQPETAELLLSGLSWMGYDGGIAVVPQTTACLQRIIAESGMEFALLPGREHMFSWAHLITLGMEEEAPFFPNKIETDGAEKRHDTSFGSPVETLEFLKKHSRLVLYAHPFSHATTRRNFLDTGEAQEMLRAGLLDGFELFNGWEFEGDCKENLAFLRRFHFPVVAGCDTHCSRTVSRPEIVYSENFPLSSPQYRDIDSLSGVRTLILAERPTPECVADAVRNNRSLVEAAKTLYGPPDLVSYLQHHGYFPIAAEDLAARRRLSLASAKKTLIAGEQAAL
ncbi:MAG: hypothetical protein PHS41_11995, partial [Victivallaceae bacterium]|nr:hypothetical protein [Victivallaceae bacterium]